MNPDIIVFALVALAGFVVAVLSLMFASNSNSRSRRLEMTWEMSRPAKLAAEVADLHAALDAYKRSNRAELGKLWQKFAKIEFVEPEELGDQARLGYGDGNVNQAHMPLTGDICENWIVAQNPANPGWRDARNCECTYCLTARAARAAERASILAKQRKPAQSNGSE